MHICILHLLAWWQRCLTNSCLYYWSADKKALAQRCSYVICFPVFSSSCPEVQRGFHHESYTCPDEQGYLGTESDSLQSMRSYARLAFNQVKCE